MAVESGDRSLPPHLGPTFFSNRWIYIDFVRKGLAFPRLSPEEGVRVAIEDILGATLRLEGETLQIGAALAGWHPITALVGQPSTEVMALFQSAAKDNDALKRARLFAAELHKKRKVTLKVNESEVEVEVPGA